MILNRKVTRTGSVSCYQGVTLYSGKHYAMVFLGWLSYTINEESVGFLLEYHISNEYKVMMIYNLPS